MSDKVATPGLVIIPYLDLPEMTGQAIADALQQLESDVRVLLIDQGSGGAGKDFGEMVGSTMRHVMVWRHDPPLPSLSATWNRALDFAWDVGYADAMVWNNDVRVGAHMYAALREVAKLRDLWFASPINCREGDTSSWQAPCPSVWDVTLGGPDFSCFLITPACHSKYRFDERFQPAYHEDGDYHRRMWLGGDGGRIAGVTLPYLHYGSQTIKRSDAADRAFAPQFAACRARYVAKWGGEPHHERKVVPDSAEDYDDVGTPGGYLDMPPPMPEGAYGKPQ